MVILNKLSYTLPFTEPVLIFALILFIILFAPIILNKIKVPHLIGLIIAGALIGPYGFNLISRDSSIELFGTVGLLYIMFLAGLEMDLNDFKKNSKKSAVFALYSFSIPMILGGLASYYILGYPIISSVLLGSMLASHTLITYPIVSKLGVTKNPVVNITIGGTIIIDTLSLLVLAVVARMAEGTVNSRFWIQLSVSLLIFVSIITFVFPLVARWFFKRFDDNISQYIFVLGMVFLGAFLAIVAGLESIIGAFFVGLTLNRLIPKKSPLMNRIDFVGNALFIPFFLIGVGMLFNYTSLIDDKQTIIVAITITIMAVGGKYLAAWITQKSYGYNKDQRKLIFGLSNARAAATLAAVMVGYNLGFFNTEILKGTSVLNGTILMILVTCTIASFATQRGGQNIARMALIEDGDDSSDREHILIPVNNPEMVIRLVNLSILLKNPNGNNSLYALNIIKNNGDKNLELEKNARKILKTASDTAAATDNEMTELIRYDINISNAISSTARENKITDLVLGLHEKKDLSDSFLGELTEGVLTKCEATTFIYKAYQPIATVKRHIIVVPKHAEMEVGFSFWISKIWNLGQNTKTKLIFHATGETINIINNLQLKYPIDMECKEFDDWSTFLILARDIKLNDSMTIVMSRKNMISHTSVMEQIPTYLNKYFKTNSFILIYPIQTLDLSNIDRNNATMDYNRLTTLRNKMKIMFKKNNA